MGTLTKGGGAKALRRREAADCDRPRPRPGIDQSDLLHRDDLHHGAPALDDPAGRYDLCNE